MTRAGVTFLDHTADVGFDVVAPTPAALFDASARAMLALLRGEEDAPRAANAVTAERDAGDPGASRVVVVGAPDAARLMADWLRELLFLHEIDNLDYHGARFDTLELAPLPGHHAQLRATVALRSGGAAVREIKGVTYHDMAVDRRPAGWAARVIFDV